MSRAHIDFEKQLLKADGAEITEEEITTFIAADPAIVNFIPSEESGLVRYTPLIWSIKSKRHLYVKALLDAGADIELADGQFAYTPLMHAVEEGDEQSEMVAYLLKRGANPNPKVITGDFKGYSPLHRAAAKGFNKIMILLIHAGAHVDGISPSFRPLYHAALGQHSSSVMLLLSAGANLMFIDAEALFSSSQRYPSTKEIKKILDKEEETISLSVYWLIELANLLIKHIYRDKKSAVIAGAGGAGAAPGGGGGAAAGETTAAAGGAGAHPAASIRTLVKDLALERLATSSTKSKPIYEPDLLDVIGSYIAKFLIPEPGSIRGLAAYASSSFRYSQHIFFRMRRENFLNNSSSIHKEATLKGVVLKTSF